MTNRTHRLRTTSIAVLLLLLGAQRTALGTMRTTSSSHGSSGDVVAMVTTGRESVRSPQSSRGDAVAGLATPPATTIGETSANRTAASELGDAPNETAAGGGVDNDATTADTTTTDTTTADTTTADTTTGDTTTGDTTTGDDVITPADGGDQGSMSPGEAEAVDLTPDVDAVTTTPVTPTPVTTTPADTPLASTTPAPANLVSALPVSADPLTSPANPAMTSDTEHNDTEHNDTERDDTESDDTEAATPTPPTTTMPPRDEPSDEPGQPELGSPAPRDNDRGAPRPQLHSFLLGDACGSITVLHAHSGELALVSNDATCENRFVRVGRGFRLLVLDDGTEWAFDAQVLEGVIETSWARTLQEG